MDAAPEAGAASWYWCEFGTTASNPRTTITGLGVGQSPQLGTSYDVRVYVNSGYVDVTERVRRGGDVGTVRSPTHFQTRKAQVLPPSNRRPG